GPGPIIQPCNSLKTLPLKYPTPNTNYLTPTVYYSKLNLSTSTINRKEPHPPHDTTIPTDVQSLTRNFDPACVPAHGSRFTRGQPFSSCVESRILQRSF